jgi:hypothetical protein
MEVMRKLWSVFTFLGKYKDIQGGGSKTDLAGASRGRNMEDKHVYETC